VLIIFGNCAQTSVLLVKLKKASIHNQWVVLNRKQKANGGKRKPTDVKKLYRSERKQAEAK